MPPRKRKADAAAADADGGDGGDHSPTPKKSKKEQLAEARARAKAWHDQRHGKTPEPTTKAAPAFSPGKSPAAKATPGQSPAAKRTPSKAGGSATKRKRTAGRRSTGGISASGSSRGISASGSSRTPGSSSAKVKQEGAARKSRASAGVAASFEFQPPAEEDEADEGEDEMEEEEPRTFEFGSATTRPANDDEDEDDEEGMEEEEEEKKPSATKRKREEGKAKIAALRESRLSQGKAVTSGGGAKKSHHRPGTHGNQKHGAGRPMGYGSPDPPTAAAAGAASMEVEGAQLKSPDPPAAASAAAAASMPPAAASAAAQRKPAARPTKPPASVAALFAQPKRANAAHRPGKAKFDPNNPFPSTGYKLPTAAYCGCGPTPGSSTSSALQSGGGAKECWRGERRISVDIDTVAGGVAAQRGSWTAKERMRSLSQVSYTGTEGEATARPEPPGRTGTDDTKEETPVNDPALGSAISRVQGLLGMAATANNDRRAAMGIHSAQIQQRATTTTGMPPRMEAAEERKDPPGGNSHGSYQATLQRFREAGGAKRPPEARAPAAPEGRATVAGQHTAETGENGTAGAPDTKEEDTPAEPAKPSALRRGIVAVFKCIMLVQMAGGMLWLAATYGSSVFQDIGQASEKVAESIDERLEERFACFLDYPTPEGDENAEPGLLEGCVGKYKQCPPWGRCHAGKLRDCDDAGGVFDGLHRFVPDKHGNACVPSPEAAEVMGAVKDALVDMTVAQNCRASDRIRDASAVSLVEPFPLFRLEEVAKRVPHPRMAEADGAHRGFLLWISPAFDEDLVRFGALSGDEGDDLDAMSLGAGVSPNSLPLPLGCTLKLMSWELLSYLAAFSLTMATFSFQNGWYLIAHYPLYVSVAVVVLYLIAVVKRKRKHRAKVKELVGVVREATYDRLAECEDHEGYAALHLRDDIARERYPNSWKDRTFLNEHVWPVIILEVRSDNRVRKFRKMSHGKDLEHWDFAIQSKRSRRQRRSLGSTPGSTPAGGNVVEMEEKMGEKRDP